MKRKSKGSVTTSIVLFATSGLMASVLGLRQYDRATTEMGWVSSAPLQAGQTITAKDLKPARVKRDSADIKDPRQLLGRTVTINKPAGGSFRAGEIAQAQAAPRSSLAQHIPQGRVIFNLKLGGQTTVPLSELGGGDRLDVLVRGRNGVRTAATDVQLVGVMKPGASAPANAGNDKITSLLPQRAARSQASASAATLVLAVDPDHVYPLAHIGSDEVVSLVLHSAHDVAAGRAVSVTPTRANRPVEVVTGLSRTTVYVAR